MHEKEKAILISGATGSGKTPLGCYLHKHGFRGISFFHFDFGEELRKTADRPARYPDLSDSEHLIIQSSLRESTLLSDAQFPVAKKIFRGFLKTTPHSGQRLIVLNGLPRRVSQAERVSALVNIIGIITLHATPETVRKRIADNTGKDRTNRIDDSVAAVNARLERYRKEITPLLEYFNKKETLDMAAAVTYSSGPVQIIDQISDALSRLLHRHSFTID